MKKPQDKKSTIQEQPATYDDYAQLPDDGRRYELAAGALELMSPAPTPKHQVICSRLLSTLMGSCENEYISVVSPIDLILANTEVRQPDLIMIHRNNKEIITQRGIEGTPDLVAEILSPHSIKRDKQDKLYTYEDYQIPEYWIVDPANETLEQYVLTEQHYKLENIFEKKDNVHSERIPCVFFAMEQILDAAGDLPG
ncbi:Uma2 family endonuclease [Salicibibacter cibi]|uniref:Uma2 family endonuclease n=1 Tax=Salicibibacter cibi TaxID=2743001 RepID=A0A7T6Z8D4_9BACI|nr:Uma2 family endonuclease [Salicibibacter cibi]QQK78742.1 Uma2 family endonuclease [Salicibibacter cibi]